MSLGIDFFKWFAAQRNFIRYNHPGIDELSRVKLELYKNGFKQVGTNPLGNLIFERSM